MMSSSYWGHLTVHGNILRQNRWCFLPVNINNCSWGCWRCCWGNKSILCVCVSSRSPTERKCITSVRWPHLGNRQSLFPPLPVPPFWTHVHTHVQMNWHTFINTHAGLERQHMMQEPRHRPMWGTLNGGWDLSTQEVTKTPLNDCVCWIKHTVITSSHYKINNFRLL